MYFPLPQKLRYSLAFGSSQVYSLVDKVFSMKGTLNSKGSSGPLASGTLKGQSLAASKLFSTTQTQKGILGSGTGTVSFTFDKVS